MKSRLRVCKVVFGRIWCLSRRGSLGISMVEYGLILGLVALAVVPALLWLGQFATTTFQDTGRAMEGQAISDPYDKSPPNNETSGDLGKAPPLSPQLGR